MSTIVFVFLISKNFSFLPKQTFFSSSFFFQPTSHGTEKKNDPLLPWLQRGRINWLLQAYWEIDSRYRGIDFSSTAVRTHFRSKSKSTMSEFCVWSFFFFGNAGHCLVVRGAMCIYRGAGQCAQAPQPFPRQARRHVSTVAIGCSFSTVGGCSPISHALARAWNFGRWPTPGASSYPYWS